jgi:hypothetical protein
MGWLHFCLQTIQNSMVTPANSDQKEFDNLLLSYLFFFFSMTTKIETIVSQIFGNPKFAENNVR